MTGETCQLTFASDSLWSPSPNTEQALYKKQGAEAGQSSLQDDSHLAPCRWNQLQKPRISSYGSVLLGCIHPKVQITTDPLQDAITLVTWPFPPVTSTISLIYKFVDPFLSLKTNFEQLEFKAFCLQIWNVENKKRAKRPQHDGCMLLYNRL